MLRFCSKNRSIVNSLYRPIVFSKYFDSTIPNPPPGTGDRLCKLMDLMAVKPAGLFSQVFNARVAFRELFESTPDDQDTIDFIENWITLRTFIAGADGLSDLELNALVEEAGVWRPNQSPQYFEQVSKKGANLSEDELKKLCVKIAESFDIEGRHAMLVNSLMAARIDGLSAKEESAYYKVAEYIGVDALSAKEVMEVYQMEVDLQERYSKLVMAQPQTK
eukprot:475415_1